MRHTIPLLALAIVSFAPLASAQPKFPAVLEGHAIPPAMTFVPAFTIENVDLIDADHIIVGNDNNLPFSSGRALGKSDDNEMVILKVGELLRAK